MTSKSLSTLLCRLLTSAALIVTLLACTAPRAHAQTNQVRFAVVGDFGDAGAAEQDVANLIAGWQPDFVITTGDNNYPAGAAATIDANIGQFYHQFIYPYVGTYGAGATTNRFFPAPGNHDWGSAYPNPQGLQPYLDYFTLPGNERYYDFVRGPVHFFALDSDPNEPDGRTSNSVQGAWLRMQLAASSARWKLVYFHHPPYSSGPHGSDVEMQWPFQAWGATAVLTGHDHDYERLDVNGLPYFVNGLGGRSLYPFVTPLPESRARYSADYGAMLVTADEQTITFEFINRAGALIDTYTLNAPPVFAGQVLISEFRPRGATGARDEYVELYNNTDRAITVATDDGSSGWAVAGPSADGNSAVVRFVVPAGTIIPARGHYLAASAAPGGYSLTAHAAPDLTYSGDLPDDAGLALFRTADPAQLNAGTRLDAVGFSTQTGALAALFRDGAGLAPVGAADGEWVWLRKQTGGQPQDTNDNATDFALVSTNGGLYGGAQSILGAPGPENTTSPIQRNATLKASLIDPQQPSTATPNRVRDTTANSCGGPNCALGTLTIRRRFSNKTGATITQLRFRIVDVTTLGTPNAAGGAQADLRALDSVDATVTTSTGNVLVKGTAVQMPPVQAQGGGLNAALVVNLPGGALAPNASVNVQFVLGVQAGGTFRFLVNVEAGSGGGAQALRSASKLGVSKYD